MAPLPPCCSTNATTCFYTATPKASTVAQQLLEFSSISNISFHVATPFHHIAARTLLEFLSLPNHASITILCNWTWSKIEMQLSHSLFLSSFHLVYLQDQPRCWKVHKRLKCQVWSNSSKWAQNTFTKVKIIHAFLSTNFFNVFY